MNITHRPTGTVDVLALEGRFDAYEVPQFNRWFDEHGEQVRVIVNLSGVGFVDSSGLASLVRSLKHCRQKGGDLYLCSTQQPVRIIFELSRMDKAFKIFEDESAALGAFL